jgi:hypothetical protein
MLSLFLVPCVNDILHVLNAAMVQGEYFSLMQTCTILRKHMISYYRKYVTNNCISSGLCPFMEMNDQESYVTILNRHILYELRTVHEYGYPKFDDMLRHERLPLSVYTEVNYVRRSLSELHVVIYGIIRIDINGHNMKLFIDPPVVRINEQVSVSKPTFIWNRGATYYPYHTKILRFLEKYMPELYTYIDGARHLR